MICGSGGSKSRLTKAAGEEPSGQMRDEKLHAVVAKHTSKSKCEKHTRFGALLEVEMMKKCTPLWREAHLEVKMLKALHVRTTFGRSTAPRYTTTKHYNYNCNYYYNYNFSFNFEYTTTTTTTTTTLQLQLQLQLQLHYTTPNHTTLQSAIVGELTTATTPKSTIPTTCRSISVFALPSMHHNNSPPL